MPRSPRGATRRLAKRKPPLSVEALWAIRRIGTPTLSPDGAWACSAVTRFDMEKNESSTSLWLFPTGLGSARNGAGRARMLTAGDKDSDPKWSPDGRFIAFTRASTPQAIAIVDVATHEEAGAITADGANVGFPAWQVP